MDQKLTLFICALLILILIKIYKKLSVKSLATYQSKILGTIEVLEKYNREKLLTINKFPQGFSIDHPTIKDSYLYKIAQITKNHCQNLKNPKILMLGLGASTVPNLFNKWQVYPKITIIEIDDQIIRANNDFFNLINLKNINLIQADAYQFLKKNSLKEKFDVIITDISLGQKYIIPDMSSNLDFINSLKKVLNKGGIIIFNREAFNAKTKDENRNFLIFLNKLFKRVDSIYIKDPRGYKNDVIIASN